MDTKMFNTSADASVPPSKTYRTKDGYVWGIYLPVKDFRHPLEKVKINDAYPQFDTWVKSNGTQAKDWYANPSEGKVWTW